MLEPRPYNYHEQRVMVYPDGKVVGDRKVIKARSDHEGYMCVTLGHPKKGGRSRVKVHRLVAECFVPNPHNLETVDHIDQDQKNNNYTNLQWLSRIDNVKKGLSRPIVAQNKSGFGYWFPSQGEADRCGFTQANVSQAIRGIRPTCKGFTWRNM